jgi:hypothetical protein
MQLTNLNMINNRIKTAKFKLSQHKLQGEKSELSVFEVARLMDTVKWGEEMNKDRSENILFSLN